jgi:hypothetical protein
VKINIYNVDSQSIYEWGNLQGAIRRYKLEVVNIEILLPVLVVE